ncbi:MAG: 30S ribosomal protein S13 [Actinobacteria bacterium]|nr:30S ribosomal protein S13 [Actinomycetota bacterium]
MALPELTPAQRADAGARATEARRVRAALRADLKSGRLRVSDVIIRAHSDEAIAKLKVVALLEALPGVGKTKAAAIMEKNAIALSRRVRGLGPHQREALTRQFG